MGLRPVTYWQAVCDACDKNITENSPSEHSAWPQDFMALDEVTDGGGLAIDRIVSPVLCAACHGEYCAGLPDEEWDVLAGAKPDAVARVASWAHLRSMARSKV
jgi:hypothetical protein